MTIFNTIKTVIKVATPIIGGKIIGKYAVQNARKDYKQNVKPPFSPPGYVFPIVWPILYTTMGVAYAIVTHKSTDKSLKSTYYTQLALNYAWSILYFKYKLRGSALIESFVLYSAVIHTTVNFYKTNRVAGVMLVPYVAWSGYATYLTTGNWLLNKDNPSYTTVNRAEDHG